MLCIILAEGGFEPYEVWKTLPNESGQVGSNHGGSQAYRDKILNDPLFKERLAMLKEEKAMLAKDDIYGDVIWMAKQTFRMALAERDTATMQRSVATLKEIAISKSGSASEVPTGAIKDGVGAKSINKDIGKADVGDMRRKLLERHANRPSEAVFGVSNAVLELEMD